jgi:hypothetical protein
MSNTTNNNHIQQLHKHGAKRKAFLLGALIVALLGAGYVALGMVTNNLKEAQKLQLENIGVVSLADEKRTLEKFLRANAELISRVEQYVIDEEGTAGFITYLESVARSKNVKLEVTNVELKPTTDPQQNSFETLKLAFSLQGSWQNVVTFIEMMERMPYYSSITSVDILKNTFVDKATQDQNGGQGTWAASVTMDILKKK